MALKEQMAVMDLLALMRFLWLPEDDLNFAIVLKGPLFGFSEEDLFRIAYDRGRECLWRRLLAFAGDTAIFAEAASGLKDLLRRVDYNGPFGLLSEILGPLGGRRKLLSRLGQEANDPIDELLTRALDYERHHPPSLQGFIAWIERSDEDIKRASDQQRDEVRIMTVHGSKGLQAPIVFLPDTLSKSRNLPKVFWLPQKEAPWLPLWSPAKSLDDPVAADVRQAAGRERDEEYHRLLYVAMTRAADRLYVCGWQSRTKAPEDCWYNLIDPAIRKIGTEIELSDGTIAWRYADPVGQDLLGRMRAEGKADVKVLPNWALSKPPAEPSPPKPLAPSRPDSDQSTPTSPLGECGNRYRRGQLIHDLLQALPALHERDHGDAAVDYLSRKAPDVPSEVRTELVMEARSVLGDPRFADVFGPNSRAEVPLTGLINGKVISGQIDRLVVSDSEVLLIDFKTNRPEPQSIDATPKVYLQQLAAYRALMEKVYPGKTITCGLLWTNSATLLEMPNEVLDRYAP
jgi:ATP-dependent helicase/nuclease subunit A